jgi:hypothetical protein
VTTSTATSFRLVRGPHRREIEEPPGDQEQDRRHRGERQIGDDRRHGEHDHDE